MTVQEVSVNSHLENKTYTDDNTYRQLLERITAVTYIDAVDESSSAIYMSPQIESMLGYPVEEWLNDSGLWLRLIHPDDQDRVLKEHLRTNQTGDPFSLEYRFIARNGHLVWVRDEAVLFLNSSGQPHSWQGVMYDITDRKNAEDELLARQRYLTQLNDITRASLEIIDFQEMLQQMANYLAKLIDADSCYVNLWDEATQKTIPIAASGALGISYPNWRIEPDDLTMTASVVHAEHVLVAEDIMNSPYISSRVAALYTEHTILGIPLIVNSERLGAALVGFEQKHKFTPQEISLAEQAAGQIALAVVKARLYSAEQQRSRQLDALHKATVILLSTLDLEELESQILTAAVKAIPAAEKGSLLLIDPQGAGLQVCALQGYADKRVNEEPYVCERSYSARAASLRSPLFIQDARSDDTFRYDGEIVELRAVLSAIVVPLVFEERVFGVISLDATRRNAFRYEDLQLLEAFAATATAAIHNAQLHVTVQELAITDGLTGFYNLRGFMELGEREIERARRFARSLAAIMFDIDHFKDVNDTYGHPIGNQVLARLAIRCSQSVRDVDLLGRYGGEEFIILLPETNLENVIVIAERLRVAIAQDPFTTDNGNISITVSLGVAMFDPLEDDLKSLLAKADHALYQAKNTGRNRTCVFESIRTNQQ